MELILHLKEQSSAQSTGKVNPALASLVKFKVAPSVVKKSATLLKQVGVGDKESTDVEEEKSKVSNLYYI